MKTGVQSKALLTMDSELEFIFTVCFCPCISGRRYLGSIDGHTGNGKDLEFNAIYHPVVPGFR